MKFFTWIMLMCCASIGLTFLFGGVKELMVGSLYTALASLFISTFAFAGTYLLWESTE